MTDWRVYKTEVYVRYGSDFADEYKNSEKLTWEQTRDKLDSLEIDISYKSLMFKLFIDYFNQQLEYYNHIKIKKEFENNQVLLDKLKRYQISSNDDLIYENNSVIHALKQTNLFDDETIDKMKMICSDLHPSINNLNELGNQFNIFFKIVKFKPGNNRWDDITQGKRYIGNPSGKLIELSLIDEHYILNERVEGIASYALKNYKEIDEVLKEKDDAYKLKIIKQSNGRFYTDSKQSHIKSYELIRLVIQNNVNN